MATSKANPVPASQAENASNIMGAGEIIVDPVWIDRRAKAI